MLRLSCPPQDLSPLSLLNFHPQPSNLIYSLFPPPFHHRSLRSLSSFTPFHPSQVKPHPVSSTLPASSAGTFVEHLVDKRRPDGETTGLESDEYFDSTELRKLQFKTPQLEVKELEELPENWRRSKLAWLCKELSSHKRTTMTRLLNSNKKWIRQEDATYLAAHCMRIRENEAAFWVNTLVSPPNKKV
uniref:Uncharacterized protein n=1 Tax=Opuntia streptacantha TaxID=393608 RepID=A0A7C9ELA7_OPUST